MYTKCNLCNKRFFIFDIDKCTKCNKNVCKECFIIDNNCKICVNNLNYKDKQDFCNRYNLTICIYCDNICKEDCEEAIEQRKYIREMLEYLTIKDMY